jgi:hypothetical protein
MHLFSEIKRFPNAPEKKCSGPEQFAIRGGLILGFKDAPFTDRPQAGAE